MISLVNRFRRRRFIERLHAHIKASELAKAKQALGVKSEEEVNETIQAQTLYLLNSIKNANQSSIGFSLYVDESTIPASGKGVFVDNALSQGRVCAFYPGSIWTWAELQKAGGLHIIDPGDCNDYLMFQLDGKLVDPTFSSAFAAPNSSAQVSSLVSKHSCLEKNPYSCAHYINHPSHGQSPNIVAWMVKLGGEHVLEYAQVIPNTVAFWDQREPMLDEVSPDLLVALTVADIPCRTELFMDYRLESRTAPNWYSAVHDPDIPVWKPW